MGNDLNQKMEAFSRLLKIMDELREQCPWDKKQTFQSLRMLTLEETYELSDAILKNNLPEIKKWDSYTASILISQDHRHKYLNGKVYFNL